MPYDGRWRSFLTFFALTQAHGGGASTSSCAATVDGLTQVRGLLSPGGGLVFCHKCDDVTSEGSFVPAWGSHYNPDSFHVHGEIVYAVPNTANEDLYNAHHVHGRIALVDRGDVPIVEKVKRVHEAGGVGVVVVDSGECGAGFTCGVLGTPTSNGFLEQDEWFKWKSIRIPVVLVRRDDGDRIKAAIDLVEMDLPDVGLQWVLRE
ncbi:Aste57867_24352 [Aphanomyces stellatus]|uniref:Aste57867_24352 protein n=1 Tax=Aphanomyces stellatus TaxID=120398 RepID=A0A485LS24_9STRA|nr:hypothetical protein As57867_024276 [Aphanomyces stellatus]VFU00992.1 Aste57867_24352 [Aphanomyces stellatus]